MTAPSPSANRRLHWGRRDRRESGARLQMRFMAIWIGMIVLLPLCAVIVPRSLLPSTFLAIIPLAAFLAIAAIGEALVHDGARHRSVDSGRSSLCRARSFSGFRAGATEYALAAIIGALLFATAIGVVNGVLIAVFKLNALIVTLAVGAITSGATLWYRESLPAEARVPPRWPNSAMRGFSG